MSQRREKWGRGVVPIDPTTDKLDSVISGFSPDYHAFCLLEGEHVLDGAVVLPDGVGLLGHRGARLVMRDGASLRVGSGGLLSGFEIERKDGAGSVSTSAWCRLDGLLFTGSPSGLPVLVREGTGGSTVTGVTFRVNDSPGVQERLIYAQQFANRWIATGCMLANSAGGARHFISVKGGDDYEVANNFCAVEVR